MSKILQTFFETFFCSSLSANYLLLMLMHRQKSPLRELERERASKKFDRIWEKIFFFWPLQILKVFSAITQLKCVSKSKLLVTISTFLFVRDNAFINSFWLRLISTEKFRILHNWRNILFLFSNWVLTIILNIRSCWLKELKFRP